MVKYDGDVQHRSPVTHFVIQSFLKRFPPGRNTVKCSNPVGDTGYIDSYIKNLGLESQCCCHHVAAIRPADDTDTTAIHPIQWFKIGSTINNILQIFLTMAFVIQMIKGLAIT